MSLKNPYMIGVWAVLVFVCIFSVFYILDNDSTQAQSTTDLVYFNQFNNPTPPAPVSPAQTLPIPWVDKGDLEKIECKKIYEDLLKGTSMVWWPITWSILASGGKSIYEKLPANCQKLIDPSALQQDTYTPPYPDPQKDLTGFLQRRVEQSQKKFYLGNQKKSSNTQKAQKSKSQKNVVSGSWSKTSSSKQEDQTVSCDNVQVYIGRKINSPFPVMIWKIKKMRDDHNTVTVWASAANILDSNGKIVWGGRKIDTQKIQCDGWPCVCDSKACKVFTYNGKLWFDLEVSSYKTSSSNLKRYQEIDWLPSYPKTITFQQGALKLVNKNWDTVCSNGQVVSIDLPFDKANYAKDMTQAFHHANGAYTNLSKSYMPGKPDTFSKTLIFPENVTSMTFSTTPLYKMYRTSALIDTGDAMFCNGCNIESKQDLWMMLGKIDRIPGQDWIEFGFKDFDNIVPYKVAFGPKEKAPLLFTIVPLVQEKSSAGNTVFKFNIYANKYMKKVRDQKGRWNEENFMPDFGNQIVFGWSAWSSAELASNKFFGRSNITVGWWIVLWFGPNGRISPVVNCPEWSADPICINNWQPVVYKSYDLVVFAGNATSGNLTVTIPAWVAQDLYGNPNKEATITVQIK